MQKAADDVRGRARLPDRPGDRRAGDGRAGHRRGAALAQSRPMGKDKEAGETYLNYVVPKKYGDANGFQAGSTFKVFVLAAAIEQGIPLSTAINSPQADEHPRRATSRTATAPTPVTATAGTSPTPPAPAPFNLYTGTQQSVNTFFAQLEAQHRPVRALRAGQGDWASSSPTRRRAVPSFTLGVADVSPLEMAEAYATFAARGLHCDSRPVTEIARPAAASCSRTIPTQCEQVMPGADRRRGQRHPARRAWSPAASARPASRSTSRRPARPARPRAAGRCGSSATPRSWRPPR